LLDDIPKFWERDYLVNIYYYLGNDCDKNMWNKITSSCCFLINQQIRLLQYSNMAKSCKVGEAGWIFGAYNRIHGQIVKICRDLPPSDWLQEIGHCVLFECPHRDFGVGQPSGLLLQPQALRASAEIRPAADMKNPSIRIQKISGSIITTSLRPHWNHG
jgi:hypothetical protein